MNARPRVGRNDPCPCGSGKKFKRCHGGVASATYVAPPKPKVFDAEPPDPALQALGWKVLGLLSDVGASIKYDRANQDDWFLKVCAYHHARLIHGITKAIIVMARGGCGWPVFAARRQAFEYFVKLAFYEKRPEQAVLYVASAPMVQKRFVEKWLKVDPKRKFPDLNLHKSVIDAMKARYQGLMVPKGKSGTTPSPVYREWSEEDLEPAWLEYIQAEAREHPELIKIARKNLRLARDVSDEEAIRMFAEEKYLMNAEYPSQEIHGTALTLIPTVDAQPPDGFAPFSDHFRNTNALVWGAVGFALDSARILARVGRAVQWAERSKSLQAEMDAIADRLGIE